MTIAEILFIGVALSMDAFAVCLSSGMIYQNLKGYRKMIMPVAFGIFQGIMPLAGFYLGSLFEEFINRFSGPIALIILGTIGLNMIREGLSPEKISETKKLTFGTLIFQAFATSIDAFAVGVSFAATSAPIFFASPIIAITTFVLSSAALIIGRKLGERLGDKAEICGGIILIAIGIKALF